MDELPQFEELISEAAHRPTRGWDFSWLDERMSTTSLPWDFTGLVDERARAASSMLDMGTGGGEWLARLRTRPAHTVATEAWPPNVLVARARLAPMGIEVVEVEAAPDNVLQSVDRPGGRLPFADGVFDLVTNRHESFVAAEVARVLAEGGLFLTQQLGDGVVREFNELLAVEPSRQSPWRLAVASQQIEAAGLAVTRSSEAQELVTFTDVGALTWYIRMVPWTVPEFSVGRCRSRLREIHELIERDGPISLPLPAFYLEARK